MVLLPGRKPGTTLGTTSEETIMSRKDKWHRNQYMGLYSQGSRATASRTSRFPHSVNSYRGSSNVEQVVPPAGVTRQGTMGVIAPLSSYTEKIHFDSWL
ncbi:unnamed protein product [Caretta caretta]